MNETLLSKKYLKAQNKFKLNYFATIIQKIYRGYIIRNKYKNNLNKNHLNMNSYQNIFIQNNNNNNYISVYTKKKTSDNYNYFNKKLNYYISSPKIFRTNKIIEELKIDFNYPKKIKEIIINKNNIKIEDKKQVYKYILKDGFNLWKEIINKNIILHEIIKNKKNKLLIDISFQEEPKN